MVTNTAAVWFKNSIRQRFCNGGFWKLLLGRLPNKFQAKQCINYLCLSQRFVASCSLHSSCHGDVDAEQITESWYRQSCARMQFFNRRKQETKTTTFSDWIVTGDPVKMNWLVSGRLPKSCVKIHVWQVLSSLIKAFSNDNKCWRLCLQYFVQNKLRNNLQFSILFIKIG